MKVISCFVYFIPLKCLLGGKLERILRTMHQGETKDNVEKLINSYKHQRKTGYALGLLGKPLVRKLHVQTNGRFSAGIFVSKIIKFLKTAILTLEMDILTLTMVKHDS